MRTLDAIEESEVDRLRELAHIGASWAASAVARLASRTILTRVPIVHGPDRFRKRGEWTTGIFCDIHGGMEGLVAIFLTEPSRDSIVEMMCGEANPAPEIVASALSEFGNILSSQTVSAIADTLGTTILPGLPELVIRDAETALQARMSPRQQPVAPLYIESELFDRQGDFRALHVLLPRLDKVSATSR